VVYARVDFTVEPFKEGEIGPHVQAALETVRGHGYEPDVGPFGNSLSGPAQAVLEVTAAAAAAALEAGASSVAMTATALPGDDEARLFLDAVRPVICALGARIVATANMSESAVPLVWKGEVLAGVERDDSPNRPGVNRNGLSALVAEVESALGANLYSLDRVAKQRAVRMLDESGAFLIRNAVDEVADAMGVSRVTVYNYLNATRSRP
jgi:uncharacterized protein YqgV (UPF0045/DUF77 family)